MSAGIAPASDYSCGLVTMLVRSVSALPCGTGLLLGLTLGAGVLLGTEPIYQPPSAWVPAGAGGLALLGALKFTLLWPRPFTVLGTALLGAAVLVACADYFLEGLAPGSRAGPTPGRHFQPCLLSAGGSWSAGDLASSGALGPWPSGSSWMRNMEATPMVSYRCSIDSRQPVSLVPRLKEVKEKIHLRAKTEVSKVY